MQTLKGLRRTGGLQAAYDWDDYVEKTTSYATIGLNQMTAAGATNFSYDGCGKESGYG